MGQHCEKYKLLEDMKSRKFRGADGDQTPQKVAPTPSNPNFRIQPAVASGRFTSEMDGELTIMSGEIGNDN